MNRNKTAYVANSFAPFSESRMSFGLCLSVGARVEFPVSNTHTEMSMFSLRTKTTGNDQTILLGLMALCDGIIAIKAHD